MTLTEVVKKFFEDFLLPNSYLSDVDYLRDKLEAEEMQEIFSKHSAVKRC